MIIIEKNTDIKIKCYKCGNEYAMYMMRIGTNGKNLVCRNCLDRKVSSNIKSTEPVKSQKIQEEPMKEYFCKSCKYNFKRTKHLSISNCPYCGASGSIMVKGSTAKIIADASKMKEDFTW